MIFSKKKKYIYIAVPKTGSRSIQQFLMEHDSGARFNQVLRGQNWIQVGDRDEARKIKEAMGNEFASYVSFAFIRHPYAKIVSSYFFFRNGEPLHENTFRSFVLANKSRKVQLIATNLKILSTHVFPFKLWAILYPYKSNKAYLFDEKGNLLVDQIGLYESLSEDFTRILDKINIPSKGRKLPHMNKSSHKQFNAYFSNPFFRKIINIKIRTDLDFYNRMKAGKDDRS